MSSSGSTTDATIPDSLPVLGRGRHRRPQQGGCFMEIASFLAGERWSDHPACTHQLLAALARGVNDRTSDAARPLLSPLIPSVIGLVSDDPLVDVRLTLLCAVTALPVAAQERQQVMAAASVTSLKLLIDLGGDPQGRARESVEGALAAAPRAAAWATSLSDSRVVPLRGFRRRIAPLVIDRAVDGVARACVPEPDALLRHLLTDAVDGVRAWTSRAPRLGLRDASGTLDDARWAQACRLTGVPVATPATLEATPAPPLAPARR